jgi:xanthosine utilization system XapX-like protein
MGEIADYFKRERYISRRLSLVILAGTVVLTPLAMAIAHGRIPLSTLERAMIAYVAFAAVSVVLVVRAAHQRFPKSNQPDEFPLDKFTERRLLRRIWLLELFAAFYAVGFFHALLHARSTPWPVIVVTAVITVLIEVVLIKAIRRLNRKRKAHTGTISAAQPNSASTTG